MSFRLEAVEGIDYFIVPGCPDQTEVGVMPKSSTGNGQTLKAVDYHCEVLRRAPHLDLQGTADDFTLACIEECPIKGHMDQRSDLPQINY